MKLLEDESCGIRYVVVIERQTDIDLDSVALVPAQETRPGFAYELAAMIKVKLPHSRQH